MLDKKELLECYEEMLLIRRFEEKSGQLYGMGMIAGFCHLYIGQEAVAVGFKHATRPDDLIITAYRDHGHILACGMDPNVVMAELLGRKDGCSKGKGGSMHMFDLEKNFYGGHGIVGAQVALGTGLAFGIKYRNEDKISLAYMGDGACNQGQVYESFNMASLWKLPIIYIIENNGYAMGTSVPRHSSTEDLYVRGQSFNIPGKQIDAQDVVNVIKEVKEAAKYVREGNGPILLELKTYRYRGHSMSDPAKYRDKEEVDKYKNELDPLTLLEKRLMKDFKVKEEEIKALEKKVKDIVSKAVDFATNSPEPDPSELYTDIYLS